MRPIPIPDGIAEAMGGRRQVFAPPSGNMLDDQIRSVEVVLHDQGISVLVQLDDHDRELAARGQPIWLSFMSRRLAPFSIEFDPGE